MKTFGEYVTSRPCPAPEAAGLGAELLCRHVDERNGSIAGAYGTNIAAGEARRTGMRRASIVPVVLVAAGCGGSANAPVPSRAPGPMSSADGVSVELPEGWTGRILIGASGRPVLHAASFVRRGQ